MRINGEDFTPLTARELRDAINALALRDPKVLDMPVHYLNCGDDEADNARYATHVEVDAHDFPEKSGDPDVDAPVWCLSIYRADPVPK